MGFNTLGLYEKRQDTGVREKTESSYLSKKANDKVRRKVWGRGRGNDHTVFFVLDSQPSELSGDSVLLKP